MIVLFDITPEELRVGLSDHVQLAVSRLVLVHRDGDHIIIIPRETVRELLRHGWTPVVRATLNRIANDFTQVGNLLIVAKYVLCIRTSEVSERAGRNNYDIVGIAEFNNLKLYAPTILLVENAATDGTLFTIILDQIARRSGIRNLRIEPAHGGGEDIVSNFAGVIEQRRFVVYIVDSDKKSPFCPSPAKYSRLKKIERDVQWRFCV